MIITFKEFVEKFNQDAEVRIGKFRWDDKNENPKHREFSDSCNCKDVNTFSKLCLPADYSLDVYTDVEYIWLGCPVINTESTELDFSAKKVCIIAPSFADNLRKAYVRTHKYSVEKRVLALASKELTHWMRFHYSLQEEVSVSLVRYTYYKSYIDTVERTNDSLKCDKKARHALSKAKAAFRRWMKRRDITEAEYFDYIAQQKKAEKQAVKEELARQKAINKEHNYINEHIFVYSDQGNRYTDYDYKHLIVRKLNTGKNTDDFDAHISNENGVTCSEKYDRNGYSRSCYFTMIRRSFTLNLKRGYNIYVIGGLITFVRGEMKREGVACEWIEQGRAIADIKTVKGYLVRGEHVVAKSLKAAQKMVREARNKRALDMMNARNKKLLHDKKLANHMFTFEESLASGNCRPGTQNFKNRYEAAIGHEATEISLTDLRKYGRQFGLESYTERVINYVARQI